MRQIEAVSPQAEDWWVHLSLPADLLPLLLLLLIGMEKREGDSEEKEIWSGGNC